ncbi:MAG: GGDEF domain-containing protein [Candidatus Moraniibacteriota bacterium]|jgi:diguanylate cyclase (GGDEF)-like protein
MNMEANFFNNSSEEKDLSEIEKKRKRVEQLGEADTSYEDSKYDLAKREGEKREKFVKMGIATENIEELADDFSDETLMAMENEKAKGLDDLTGLKNRNAYNNDIPTFVEMSKREGHDSSFLMLDFDHFKRVNDEHGHGAGDTALQKISAIIKDTVRGSDVVYRYGGEEFVVFLPDTDSRGAQETAEKIRRAVEDAEIVVVDNDSNEEITLKKTISVGCVGTDQIENWKNIDSEKFAGVIAGYADRALYASKENGRNQVTMFSESLKEIKK